MFRENTVIVVGAGAGVEYNMPLGSKLVEESAKDVRFRFERHNAIPTSGNIELYRELQPIFAGDPNVRDRYIRAGDTLSSVLSSSISIDDALYQLSETPEAVTLGKMCIVNRILQAENASWIQMSSLARPHEGAGRNGWIEQIFSMAIAGRRHSEMELAFQKVTFVIFNYDRCVEYYIYWSLLRIKIEDGRAGEIVKNLNIIRPYGGLGSILPSDPKNVPFGGSTNLLLAISKIKTYAESESIHDDKELSRAIRDARLVLFLGFGFHPQNMELLEVAEIGYRLVMATVKNLHAENRAAIRDDIVSKLRCEKPARVELFDMTAPEMLRELRPRIQLVVG